MSDRILLGREDEKLEALESDEELDSWLNTIAPYVGWIIIYFNSLEDHISDFIREAVLRDPIQDERMDVFLSEMQFSNKCRALINLYGQVIEGSAVHYTQKDLVNLEKILLECSMRRNEYAHADWIGVKEGNYVQVKSQSKKLGIQRKYKKFEIPKMGLDVKYINDARYILIEFNDNLYAQLTQ